MLTLAEINRVAVEHALNREPWRWRISRVPSPLGDEQTGLLQILPRVPHEPAEHALFITQRQGRCECAGHHNHVEIARALIPKGADEAMPMLPVSPGKPSTRKN